MGVVKTARKVGHAVVGVLDEEDRQLFAQLVIWAFGILCVAVLLGLSLGLAIHIGRYVAG